MSYTVPDNVLEAEKLGNWFNLVHLALDVNYYLTDNFYDCIYGSNNYVANGLLVDVDPGAMSMGVKANDWQVTLSSVQGDIFNTILAGSLHNRWVHHYVAFWEETDTGREIIDVERKKSGQIRKTPDFEDTSTAKAIFTLTSPLGAANKRNVLKTNIKSHQLRFPEDKFMQFSHETTYDVSASDGNNNAIAGLNEGTILSTVPVDED